MKFHPKPALDYEHRSPENVSHSKVFDNYDEEESYGEVNKIIGSKALRNSRDIDAMDEDGQTALLFVSMLSSEQLLSYRPRRVQMLTTRDNSGRLMALHMAAGYVGLGVANVLLEFSLNLV
ncbi:Signal recognition particle 43 kDa protein [Abeliophyllum distichum]|uniref:Signal recognition particle 43 kDa protein n=1 Tax=Abeliophyllum distichum TaxID=126358 RepID=A0ABD1V9H6_9LAMI